MNNMKADRIECPSYIINLKTPAASPIGLTDKRGCYLGDGVWVQEGTFVILEKLAQAGERQSKVDADGYVTVKIDFTGEGHESDPG